MAFADHAHIAQRKDAPLMGIHVMAAAEAAAAAKKSSSSVEFLFIIVLMVVGVYFLILRPQRRRAAATQQQQKTVSPGAQVRTTAGMYATVVEVDGDDVVLEVAPGVEVRYMKRAIMEVITPGDEVEEEAADSEYEDDDTASTEDDLDGSHDQDIDAEHADDDLDERASANGAKAKSDSDVF
jgi:preprotein translocase subunit YajC